MKRLLSTLLAAIGVLAVVAVAAVVYVTTFVDPEDLKPRLIEVVREQSGLELALEGPLTWSFYPRIGVSVEKAEAWLPEQTPGEEPSFAAFRRGEVSLTFAPLLRGEIAIDGLTLEGVQLNLERDEAGRGNWETLIERLGAGQAEAVLAPANASAAPLPGGDGLAVALNVANVQIRDGRVSYRDRVSDRHLQFSGVEVSGSNVNLRRAFPLRASFRLSALQGGEVEAAESEAFDLASDVALEGRLTLDLPERRYRLDELTLTTVSQLAEVAGEQRARLQSRQALIDADERRLQLSSSRLETTLTHPALGAIPLALALAFDLEADLAAETAQLRDLELTGDDGLRLSGNLGVSELFGDLEYRGQLRLAPLSLRPWLTRFDALPVMASESALTELTLTSPVQGDREGIELPGLTLLLDGSTFTGRLGAALNGSRLDFDLQGDRLDLDPYLPPPAAETAGAVSWLPGIAAALADDPGGLVPAEWLAGLTLDGRLSVGRMRLGDLPFEDVELALAGADGRQRLTRFEAGFFEGTLAATGELDLTRDPIRWALAPQVSRLRLGTLLEALGEEPSPLRGRLSAQGELSSSGNTWPGLKRHLDGRLAAHIDDGAILDVNVSRELCTLVAALEGRETERDWHPDTRFERAEARFLIRDGTLISDDLQVTLPGIELGGEGWLDLVSERFELLAAARVVDGADAACRIDPRLERIPFPVRCEGALSGDSAEWCRFDRQAFQEAVLVALRGELGRRAGEELERRLERPLQRLEERLGEGVGRELRDGLRGLFQ